VLFPALGLILLVLGFNFVADGPSRLMNPRHRAGVR